MNKLKRKQLYHAAINKWGFPLQLGMLMEECAELIQATHKVIRRGYCDINVWRDFAEEIADVEIMIEQLKTTVKFHDLETAVKTNKHDKLLRLENTLKDE